MTNSPNPTPETNDHSSISATIGAGATNVAVGTQITQVIGFSATEVEQLMDRVRRQDQPITWDGRTPYLGLTTFQETDAEFFFGREKLVEELLERVQQVRFVCVAGPSGSGKSSLVQAGLIHALKQDKLAGSGKWRCITLTPRADPIEQLAQAMVRLAQNPSAGQYLRERGLADANALHQQAEALLSADPSQRLIVYADQFEELFTQTKNEEVRRAFLALLTTAAQQTNGRVIVILSLRADFVAQCASYPELRELINQQFQLVGALAPEELARAIVLPALEVGAQIEPALVEQLIADTKGEPGALPLLQFALKDLFDAQSPHKGDVVTLTRKDYLARGGLHQALERHAESVFAQLTDEQKQLARQIFTHLIEVGRGAEDTRRTTVFAELLTSTSDIDQVTIVVQLLAQARLITIDDPSSGENDDEETFLSTLPATRTLTLAHEKLIEAWPWLRRLVDENREAIALQNQLNQDAQEWKLHEHDSSYLYKGGRLAVMREQLMIRQIALNALVQAFIDAAVQAEALERQQLVAARQREEQNQRALAVQTARAEEQRRRTIILRRFALGLTVLAFIAIVAGIIAFQQKSEADVQRREAQNARVTAEAARDEAQDARATAEAARDEAHQNARLARGQAILAGKAKDESIANQLLAQALLELDSHPQLSLLLSVESILAALRSGVSDMSSFNDVLQKVFESTGGIPLYKQRGGIAKVAFSPNGQFLATASHDATVIIWDFKNRIKKTTIQGSGTLFDVEISPNGQRLTTVEENIAQLWDTKTGKTLVTFQGHSRPINDITISPDGYLLVTASSDGTARIWDTESGQMISVLAGHTAAISKVVFTPNGHLLATASRDHVRIWDIESRQQLIVYKFEDNVTDIAVSSDGMWLAAGSLDRTARLWSLSHLGQEPKVFKENVPILAIAFAPDSTFLITSAGTGNVAARIWPLTAQGPANSLTTLTTQTQGEISMTDISSDGRWLATVERGNNIVKLWDLHDLEIAPISLHGHDDFVSTIAFSPDAKWLVTGSNDDTVRLWNLEKLESKDEDVLPNDLLTSLRAVCQRAGRDLTQNESEKYLSGYAYEGACSSPDGLSSRINYIAKYSLNGGICWQGSLNGIAKEILAVCEKAVELAPQAGNIRDSRGLARALTYDIEGAIKDFEFFIDWSARTGQGRNVAARREWIRRLKSGEDPAAIFDAATLERLKND